MNQFRYVAATWAIVWAANALAESIHPVQVITQRLTAGGLKADVSFLASDLLEGRATPSLGLDIAAEYVAAQLRRAGLEPAGDDDFFQTAHYLSVSLKMDGVELALEDGGKIIKADAKTMAIVVAAAVELTHAAALKLTPENAAGFKDQLRSKVVFLEVPNRDALPAAEWEKAAAEYTRLRDTAESGKPSLLILIDSRRLAVPQTQQLRDPSAPPLTPTIRVSDGGIRSAIAAAKAGPLEITVSAHLPEPSISPVVLRNVVGILRGSDSELKDTYEIISAHYDHLGVRLSGAGDRIYNGANDDASGTASVIEIAQALAALPEKPKRSIIFVSFFGGERGLLGSRYYLSHPVVPPTATVADINLEQMGRTDDVQGRRLLQFNATGYDYTTITKVFGKAGEDTGIRLVKDEENSDRYFSGSDNLPFAEAGIPSTTFSVTYEFPDYHMPGDEWTKLDYENMAAVDRAVAWGAWMIAEDPQPPEWNVSNPKVDRYIRARESSQADQQPRVR